MTGERPLPRLARWPFFLGDALLLAVAVVIVVRGSAPLSLGQCLFLVVSVALGAGLAIYPLLTEYRTRVRLVESDTLTNTVQQIQNLETVARHITTATARWQTAQEHAENTVTASREIAERMSAEAKEFARFMEKVNDAEKGRLRLEVEKMRRVEGEWLQAVVRLLDHVHALYAAAARSGQPDLKEQIGNFQDSCRDSVRRLGLVSFTADAEEPFAEDRHQLLDPQTTTAAGARIAETIAAGYTFQGQLLRKALVSVRTDVPGAAEEPQSIEQPAAILEEAFTQTEPAAAEAPSADPAAAETSATDPAGEREVGLYEPPPDESSEGQLTLEEHARRDSRH